MPRPVPAWLRRSTGNIGLARDPGPKGWAISYRARLMAMRPTTKLSSRRFSRGSCRSNSFRSPTTEHPHVAQAICRTGNLRAVQILLGHTKIESAVRYLGIEVDHIVDGCALLPSAATAMKVAAISSLPALQTNLVIT